jgi:glycosyltransferase involved in cell wall biosynthesis
MHVLFIDSTYHKPYSLQNLKTQALGGTEATVLRVLGRLAEHCNITFAQSHRTVVESEDSGLSYIPLDSVWNRQIAAPDAVVCIRTMSLLHRLCRLYPDAKKYVWMHNFRKREIILYKRQLHRADAALICVSRYHREHTNARINSGLLSWLGSYTLGIPDIPVHHIYNPINDRLRPGGHEADIDKLVCFSAPHKGLQEILAIFKTVREAIPELKLYLSTPMYGAQLMNIIMDDPKTDARNTIILGALPQSEILEQVKSALCVFYPQTQFAESFGLIYAEANALGTPVLAHDIGAASEVLCDSNPVIDCTDPDLIIDTLRNWRNGERPQVEARSEFRLSKVIDQWLNMLNA